MTITGQTYINLLLSVLKAACSWKKKVVRRKYAFSKWKDYVFAGIKGNNLYHRLFFNGKPFGVFRCFKLLVTAPALDFKVRSQLEIQRFCLNILIFFINNVIGITTYSSLLAKSCKALNDFTRQVANISTSPCFFEPPPPPGGGPLFPLKFAFVPE